MALKGEKMRAIEKGVVDIHGKNWGLLKKPNKYKLLSRCPDTGNGILQINIDVSCEIIDDLIDLDLIKPRVEKQQETANK